MSRDIRLLHPKLQSIIPLLIRACFDLGLPPVLITETLRTAEEQDALYAKGRLINGVTVKGPIVTNCKGTDFESLHQWGVACDFCRNVKGREFDDTDKFFSRVGAQAKRLGLDWGGDWKTFIDKPHLQMREFSPDGTAKFLKSKYKTPAEFIKTWRTVT